MESHTQKTDIEALLRLHAEGWIPGPEETTSTFLMRVYKDKQAPIQEEIKKKFHDATFPDTNPWLPLQTKLLSLCAYAPTETIVFYSNKKLPFWHGAATWIDEGISVIQLKKPGRLTYYSQDEILMHESVHVARSAFNEPRFEEILAYQVSSSRWRRYLGPLFRHTWESSVLLLLTCAGMIMPQILWLCATFFGYLLCRLSYNQVLFRRCLKKLSYHVGSKAFALAVRMPDAMICTIARMPKENIPHFLQKNSLSPLCMLLASLIRTWNT